MSNTTTPHQQFRAVLADEEGLYTLRLSAHDEDHATQAARSWGASYGWRLVGVTPLTKAA